MVNNLKGRAKHARSRWEGSEMMSDMVSSRNTLETKNPQTTKKKERNVGFATTCLIRGSIRSRDENQSDILQNELIAAGSNPDGQTDTLTGKV